MQIFICPLRPLPASFSLIGGLDLDVCYVLLWSDDDDLLSNPFASDSEEDPERKEASEVLNY